MGLGNLWTPSFPFVFHVGSFTQAHTHTLKIPAFFFSPIDFIFTSTTITKIIKQIVLSSICQRILQITSIYNMKPHNYYPMCIQVSFGIHFRWDVESPSRWWWGRLQHSPVKQCCIATGLEHWKYQETQQNTWKYKSKDREAQFESFKKLVKSLVCFPIKTKGSLRPLQSCYLLIFKQCCLYPSYCL